MGININQIIWALVILFLGIILTYSLKVYLRDQNKIQASTQRANCQIELVKAEKEDFTICQDIINSTPRDSSIF